MMAEFTAVANKLMLPMDQRPAGSYTSDPVTDTPGTVTEVVVLVYVREVEGSPTVDCFLETSLDATAWSAVPGSATAQLSAPGSASANAQVGIDEIVRVSSTVTGEESANATYRVLCLTGSD